MAEWFDEHYISHALAGPGDMILGADEPVRGWALVLHADEGVAIERFASPQDIALWLERIAREIRTGSIEPMETDEEEE
jgi:hypothetical protein